MPCRLAYGWARRGNTVPYSPSVRRAGHGRKRDNRGFADLRGRPDVAADVAEAAGSPELSTWLIELATPRSRLFSLGCDLGKYRKRTAGDGLPHATGGYVQMLAADYTNWAADGYKAVAEKVAPSVEAAVGEDHWDVSFLLQAVQFNLDGFNDELVSLTVEFNAWAASPMAAAESRERLIRALRLEFGNAQAGIPASSQASEPERCAGSWGYQVMLRQWNNGPALRGDRHFRDP